MKIPILDTHQHLVFVDRWPYSWTYGIPALANRCFDYNDYLTAIEGTGIAGTIFMETTPDDPHWQDEGRYVAELMQQPNSLIRSSILNCRPETDGFEAYLDTLDTTRVCGLRRFLHAAPEGTADVACFIPNLQRLAARGLSFDLCIFEKQMPLALRIAQACPEVQFVLDHCAVPQIDGGDFKQWARRIDAIAQCDNVACKVSGVLAYCAPEGATTEAVRPYVEHCIESFGWERVIWGGDWPVVTLTSSLRQWVATSREIVAREDVDHQANLFHQNAERIYKLSKDISK
jgi:predicted TIM-barrel fold metal-dependent hydrolase